MKNLFDNVFQDLTVLVTGHTGFKGSWLSIWLTELGADVIGYSLPDAPTTPSNFDVSGVSGRITDVRGDIRDLAALRQTIARYRPDLVFHLAAQPIVLQGLKEPKLTFDTNAGGTVNVLEAVRMTDSVRAVVSVTTDKVYENREWLWGYRENDRLGGHDPYSASKAMAELAIESYRHSFFAREGGERPLPLASVRAGNVIGGGDFAEFRLVPDCMRALMAEEPIQIRNPLSVRPWQHVLEPLSGYLQLAARLLQEGQPFAEAWNFGPLEQKGVTAQAIAEKLIALWGGAWERVDSGLPKVETGQLRLSWDKAAARLDWRPVYTWEEALTEITAWFKAYQNGHNMYDVCLAHIQAYVQRAQVVGVGWIS